MAVDPRCCVPVGVHPGPYYKDANTGMLVCSRHRGQYEERSDEFEPFDWQPQEDSSG